MGKQSKPRQKLSGIVLPAIVVIAFVSIVYILATNTLASEQASGETVEAMELITISGETVTIPDTNGDVSVIYTMAYWCGTCIPEAQALAQLNEEFDDLHIVVVDIDPSSTPTLIRGFINAVGENDLTWTLDTDGHFSREYNVRVLDTTIILDKSGREVYRDAVPTPYNILHEEIEKVINA